MFDYKVHYTNRASLEAMLNEHGKDGWAIASLVLDGPTGVLLVLYRQKQD